MKFSQVKIYLLFFFKKYILTICRDVILFQIFFFCFINSHSFDFYGILRDNLIMLYSNLRSRIKKYKKF